MENIDILAPIERDIERTFSAYENLPFADKALIIIEPGVEFYALYFFRKGNELKIFDDLDYLHYRKREGFNHSINTASHQLERAKTLEEFLQDVSRSRWNTSIQRYTAEVALSCLEGLYPMDASRHPDYKPGDAEKMEVAFREYRDELLLNHMGVSMEDLRYRSLAPQDTIVLRPLSPTQPRYLRKRLDNV